MAGPRATASARIAAVQFQSLYFGGRFADSWGLLATSAKRLIPRKLWTRVHESCPPARDATAGTVGSITIFSNTAIIGVSHGDRSSRSKDYYVLSYANGRWGYAPNDMSLYHRGSLAADLAAARKAGFCGSRKVF